MPPTTAAALRYVPNFPKNYFKLHKKILKICGISFSPNENLPYKLYSFVILTATLFVYPILASLELFKHDFATASGILIYQTGTIVAAIKALLMIINRKKMENLLNKLEEEPFLPNPTRGGDQEKELILECLWKINLQTNVYWIFSASNITLFSLYALSTRLTNNDFHQWLLPYKPLTILDITQSPNYEITWFYQSVCLCVTAGVYVITDLIIAGLLAYVSYQFKILQHFLRNIVAFSRKEMLLRKDSTNHWKYLQNSIKQAVEYHLAILDLTQELEDYFRYLILATFLGILGILCFHSYLIGSYTNEHVILRHVVEYFNASLPVVMICYWGEEIFYQSVRVGNAAFEADFPGSDLRFQNALVMIIRRSQMPAKLTAGKFVDVSLATCIWVWRKSYAICTVLRHINRK